MAREQRSEAASDVVIGGLISATLLTLFVLPTLYARLGRRELPTPPKRSPRSRPTAVPLLADNCFRLNSTSATILDLAAQFLHPLRF